MKNIDKVLTAKKHSAWSSAFFWQNATTGFEESVQKTQMTQGKNSTYSQEQTWEVI